MIWANLGEMVVWKGASELANVSDFLEAANIFIDAGQAGNELDELIDARFEVADNLAFLRAELDLTTSFNSRRVAIQQSLVEKYNFVNGLYKQVNGQCPPTSAALQRADAEDLVMAAALEPQAAVLTFSDPLHGATVRFGTDGDDTITESLFVRAFVHGGAGNDQITAGPSHNVVFGGMGDDLIAARGGRDVVGFVGARSEYTIERLADGSLRVSDSVAGRDGADLITDAEGLAFANGLVRTDPSAPLFVDARPTEAVEDGRRLVFDVCLSSLSDSDVIVPWHIENAAELGSDLGALSGQVTITAGSMSSEIVIPIVADQLVNQNEIVALRLGRPTGASLLRSGSDTLGTIIDDDGGAADLLVTRLDQSIDNLGRVCSVSTFGYERRWPNCDECDLE